MSKCINCKKRLLKFRKELKKFTKENKHKDFLKPYYNDNLDVEINGVIYDLQN